MIRLAVTLKNILSNWVDTLGISQGAAPCKSLLGENGRPVLPQLPQAGPTEHPKA